MWDILTPGQQRELAERLAQQVSVLATEFLYKTDPDRYRQVVGTMGPLWATADAIRAEHG